jgi:phosphomannomutase
MEERFRRDFWPRLSERFREFRILNYEGTECVEVRTGDEAGGWRVDLYREGERCFIFARGSRTEAGVWRVVADSPDGEEARQLLDVGLDLLRSLEGVAVGRGT